MGHGLIIKEVIQGSLAEEAGIQAGQRIVSINGNKLQDLIDLEFYQADGEISVLLECDQEGAFEVVFEKDPDERLGLVLDPPPIRRCPNDCDFCFVDQMPPGQRQSLYIRDEDYRYSFMYGNFITLTNLSEKDYQRILSQRLSPLYISVHATDSVVRKRLLRNERAPDILERIDLLVKGGIRLQTQIVVTPGVNDGEVLDRSVKDLSARYPGVSSLAIVPVGLTQHRSNLPSIAQIDMDFARKMLGVIERYQRPFIEKWDDPFVYPADEWYVIAGKSFPALKRYGSLLQLGNGVGMVSLFQTQWRQKLSRSRQSFLSLLEMEPESSPPCIALITGTAFNPYLLKLVALLEEKFPGWNGKIRVIQVENRLFGASVTVAGLLGGNDILDAVQKEGLPPGSWILIPDVAIRADSDVLIDDLSVSFLSKTIGTPVFQVPSEAAGFWDWVLENLSSLERRSGRLKAVAR
ncbi:MAG: DUF512 domain-containing protein [Leptospirales bacterium]